MLCIYYKVTSISKKKLQTVLRIIVTTRAKMKILMSVLLKNDHYFKVF